VGNGVKMGTRIERTCLPAGRLAVAKRGFERIFSRNPDNYREQRRKNTKFAVKFYFSQKTRKTRNSL